MIRFNGGHTNLYVYCGNDPVSKFDIDGLRVYGVQAGVGGFVTVGAKGSVMYVWDDCGNKGILFSGGGGFGVEITTKITAGLYSTRANSIYDIDEYTGLEMSASFGLNATFNDKNEMTGIGGIGVGGSISWGGAFLVPINSKKCCK